MKQTIKMLASVILGNTLLAFAICAFHLNLTVHHIN